VFCKHGIFEQHEDKKFVSNRKGVQIHLRRQSKRELIQTSCENRRSVTVTMLNKSDFPNASATFSKCLRNCEILTSSEHLAACEFVSHNFG
jgi:hypothetical protein